MGANEFIMRVDRALSKLRSHLLGFDTPLERMLPRHLSQADPTTKAAFLSRELAFLLARRTDALQLIDLPEHEAFLFEMIRYILSETDKSSHNFESLTKLTETTTIIRAFVLEQSSAKQEYHVFASFEPSQFFSSLLEQAILELIGLKKLEENFLSFQRFLHD